MVMRDGVIRNSVIHSITSTEWPEVKSTLVARLA